MLKLIIPFCGACGFIGAMDNQMIEQMYEYPETRYERCISAYEGTGLVRDCEIYNPNRENLK